MIGHMTLATGRFPIIEMALKVI